MIKHLVNPLSTQQANQLEDLVSGNMFPWFYFSNTHSFEKTKHISYGFQHTVIADGQDYTQLASLVRFVTYSIANAAGLSADEIVHVRFNLLPKQSVEVPLFFHTDIPNDFAKNDVSKKHYSALYYINDSDGCTVFEKSNKRIEPIKNTAVVFDGNLMHSASYPLVATERLVLNMNFFSNA